MDPTCDQDKPKAKPASPIPIPLPTILRLSVHSAGSMTFDVPFNNLNLDIAAVNDTFLDCWSCGEDQSFNDHAVGCKVSARHLLGVERGLFPAVRLSYRPPAISSIPPPRVPDPSRSQSNPTTHVLHLHTLITRTAHGAP